MAETTVYDWDAVNVDETVTEADQKAAENLSVTTPVGKMLVTIAESSAIENAMKDYTCIAANFKMRIDAVLEMEKPVLDDSGNPLKRNDEIVKKVRPLTDDEKAAADALYAGRFVFEKINLAHPKEKDAMKNRRLFIAGKLKLIAPGSAAQITGAMWGRDTIGRQVVITTELNRYTSKAGEEKESVRVKWGGWDYPETAGAPEDDDFSSI